MNILEVRDLDAFYGDFQALFGVSLDVVERADLAFAIEQRERANAGHGR